MDKCMVQSQPFHKPLTFDQGPILFVSLTFICARSSSQSTQAAFRAIEKCIQRPEQPDDEVALQLSYRNWFLQCFTDSPTIPGDPKLNFWSPGIFFGNSIPNVNNSGEPVPVFIVVSDMTK